MPGMRGLVLLSLCLNLHTGRAFPNKLPDLSSEPPGLPSFMDPLLDYDLLDEELGGGGGRSWNGTGGAVRCGPCEPDLCPETRGCRAGLVLDSCGCCKECGNLEGQACDPGDRSVYYGLCGTGLRCQADPRPAAAAGGGEEDEEEEVCVCEEQEAVCGSDGTTYMNTCQFREAAFSRPELKIRGRGPCKTGRTHLSVYLCHLSLSITCLSVDSSLMMISSHVFSLIHHEQDERDLAVVRSL